jgi:hypothetical protein
LVEDLSTYMESLVDLSPSLEHPATDILVYDTNTAPIDDLSSVLEAARPFVIIIKDRFPSIEPALGRKLGEANWLRRERLRKKIASAAQADVTQSPFMDDLSDVDTVIAPNNRSSDFSAPSVHSTVRPPSHYQSVTTRSAFSDPSLFDGDSIAERRQSRNIWVAESVTSFVTSLADGPEYGQRRVPQLPEDHNFDAPFQCQACGDIQLNIRNRGKQHRGFHFVAQFGHGSLHILLKAAVLFQFPFSNPETFPFEKITDFPDVAQEIGSGLPQNSHPLI